MAYTIREHLLSEIAAIREQGLYKSERVLESPQRARIEVSEGEVLNFCAPRTRFSTHPASTPTGACSRHCFLPRTR